MSMFDGLTDALASVPPQSIKFSYSDIDVLINALMYYANYHEDREIDEQPIEYGHDGRPVKDIANDLFDFFMNYKFS